MAVIARAMPRKVAVDWARTGAGVARAPRPLEQAPPMFDLSDLRPVATPDLRPVVRAAKIAIAGRMPLLVIGPHGAGLTLLARRLADSLPALGASELSTLATIASASGIIADWRDLIFGIRSQITVRVLSETYMGSNLQIAVLAYARVDFAATRPASFCTLEGITV